MPHMALFLAQLGVAALPDLCHLHPLPAVQIWAGNGTGTASAAASGAGCASLHFASTTGMAAEFHVGSATVKPLKYYEISMELKTSNLLPTPLIPHCVEVSRQRLGTGLDNQTSCSGAYLTGAPYVSYIDGQGRKDGWFPAYGTHATPTADWHNVSLRFAPPTTAVQADIHIAFGAHEYAYKPQRMTGGSATGKAWVRNIKIVESPSPPAVVLPATFSIPASEKNLSNAIQLAAKCLHNSQISGNFTVGSDYVISGNLSPDLAFGLLGTRRLAHGSYMKTWESTVGHISPPSPSPFLPPLFLSFSLPLSRSLVCSSLSYLLHVASVAACAVLLNPSVACES